jgi:hypothetical protein
MPSVAVTPQPGQPALTSRVRFPSVLILPFGFGLGRRANVGGRLRPRTGLGEPKYDRELAQRQRRGTRRAWSVAGTVAARSARNQAADPDQSGSFEQRHERDHEAAKPAVTPEHQPPERPPREREQEPKQHRCPGQTFGGPCSCSPSPATMNATIAANPTPCAIRKSSSRSCMRSLASTQTIATTIGQSQASEGSGAYRKPPTISPGDHRSAQGRFNGPRTWSPGHAASACSRPSCQPYEWPLDTCTQFGGVRGPIVGRDQLGGNLIEVVHRRSCA